MHTRHGLAVHSILPCVVAAARAATLAALTLGPALTIGCATSAPPPAIDNAPFTSFPCRIDSSAPEHVAVFSSPSPGYQATFTRMMDGPGRKEVFVTLRKPNPAVVYAQVVVEQRVATPAPSKWPVWVYARLLPFDAKDTSDAPFGLAARSDAKP
jgi:hypothetical protein